MFRGYSSQVPNRSQAIPSRPQENHTNNERPRMFDRGTGPQARLS